MTTRKLYWQDPYRTTFTARVVRRLNGECPGVILNRTIFYPTGGGQPHDTGLLGGIPVLDVTSDENGDIIHWLESPLPGDADEVSGEIDWARRYDHMQQHSGQHLLSAAFQDILYRPTIGFHLSENTVTIDLPGPPPDDGALSRVLDFVQAAIAEARPIIAREIPLEEAVRLPLRKPPTVDGLIRVVAIEGLDWSACGGTHVRNTSEIGHLVITRMERRGDQTRVYFLAGGRAVADHLQRIRITRELSALLTTGVDDLPAAIGRLQEQMQQSHKALRQAQDLVIQAEARRLIAEAPHSGGVDIVYHIVESDDAKELNRLIRELIAVPSVVALLGWTHGGKARWVAGRSTNVPLDMLESLEEVKDAFGVQGGGSPELIQGAAADEDTMHKVLHLLQAFAFDLQDIS
jgi:alanyl-tRNA synthetase